SVASADRSCRPRVLPKDEGNGLECPNHLAWARQSLKSSPHSRGHIQDRPLAQLSISRKAAVPATLRPPRRDSCRPASRQTLSGSRKLPARDIHRQRQRALRREPLLSRPAHPSRKKHRHDGERCAAAADANSTDVLRMRVGTKLRGSPDEYSSPPLQPDIQPPFARAAHIHSGTGCMPTPSSPPGRGTVAESMASFGSTSRYRRESSRERA